jgi:hypothetical protein
MSRSQLTLDGLKTYSTFLGDMYSIVQGQVASLKGSLFGGTADSNGNDMFAYIKDGAFAPIQPSSVAKASDYLYKVITAGAINVLYKANNAYIVGAPSPDCGSDNRGPSDLRVCLGDGNVYYIYMLVNL